MRRVWCLTITCGLVAATVVEAQSPDTLYTWAGTSVQGWQVYDANLLVPLGVAGQWNTASISGATGDLVVTETSNGTGNGVIGGGLSILEGWYQPREVYPAKGNLDVTGLQYIEIDLRHNSPTATVSVGIGVAAIETENVGIGGPAWNIGPGLNTIRFPISLLTARQQTSVKSYNVLVTPHTAVGNLIWTISAVRTVGTPLVYRDIVTNNAGTPDDGIDGAFPLYTADMAAIIGNNGVVSQLGLTRNPSGTGSLQWTDKGGAGDVGSESGASIGWGNGAGWRNTTQADQIGSPTSGNSYNERIADFSNYDRMTVKISAHDAVNPSGAVGIEAPFFESESNPPTVLTSQDLQTDGQYHELVFDLSSVSFRKNLWHWGLDVSAHANNIVFNIDNIRLWNSAAQQGVPGDYNGNSAVDAADYVLWRNGGSLANEGATPGSNTPEDYSYWRSRFGATSANAGAAYVSNAVPEPAVTVLLVGVLAALSTCREC